MTKISIIVPVYNKEEHLEETIFSLLNQTFNDFEIIAIDDGSSDNSLNILEKITLVDRRLKVYSQKNMGVSIARNKGIELSTGDYINFFDADDLMDENFWWIL